VGWQPSCFLSDRAEAERAFALAEQLGSINAAAAELGTTLVEAAALGRRAVGVELEPRWAELARSNLTHALPADRAALAEVRVGDARQLHELLADLAGRVDLLGRVSRIAW
jgi:hypothetical protein